MLTEHANNANLTGDARPAVGAATFDVEAWFHAHNLRVPRSEWSTLPARLDNTIDRILALLDAYDTHATFFVLGSVAERLPRLIRRIHAAGHEIASHGYRHQSITEQTPARFRRDVHSSKAVLEALTGEAVTGYRAPNYSIEPDTAWALDELGQMGFLYDSSIYPTRAPHGRYGFPASPLCPHRIRPGLWEFPLPTLRVLGRRVPAVTGGYLRAMPLSLTRWAIRQNHRRCIPVVLNLHPWEFDPDQPRRRVPIRNRALHYTGLRTTAGKLERLLKAYRFVPLRELLAQYDPSVRISEPQTVPRKDVLHGRAAALRPADRPVPSELTTNRAN